MAVVILSLVVFFVSLYCYCVDHFSKKRIYALKNVIPGPKPLPILGNTPLFFMKSSTEIFEILVNLHENYERYFALWNDGKCFVFLQDADDIQAILTDNQNITKADLYKFALPWIGEGLLTSTGNKWKKHRRVITPTFFFNILEEYLNVFHKNDEIFMKQLEMEAGNGPFNIYPYVNRYAFDNICETAMGVDFKVQTTRDSVYAKAIRDISRTVSMRIFEVQYMLDFVFYRSSHGQIQNKAIKIAHDKAFEIIRGKRARLDNHPNPQGEGKKKPMFVDILVETAGAQLTDQEINDEINTFLFEEQIYDEQVGILGDVSTSASTADMNAMVYLEQVMKEAARLYPSVSLIGRRLDADLQLPLGPLLPAGTNIAFFLYALHRNPKVWKNPEEFNPDNFAGEVATQRHPFAYVPFSAGPRNCIGQKFAKMEMKTAISRLVRKFHILPSPDPAHRVHMASELVLTSKNGFHVRLEKRAPS